MNGDVAKTGDTSLLHYSFSAVIKALIVQHEQGFIPVVNYELRKCVTIPMTIYQLRQQKSNAKKKAGKKSFSHHLFNTYASYV